MRRRAVCGRVLHRFQMPREIAMFLRRTMAYRVEQISEIMKRFQWDDGKLKVAKAAYGNCSDKRNYSTLTGNFTFLGNKNDLLDFIEKQQRMR